MLHALFNAMRRGLFNAAPFLIQRSTLFIATRHATSLQTPSRLANGKPYSLSPTRFTTPSTSVASGRAASSTCPSGESNSRRGASSRLKPSISSSCPRTWRSLYQYSPCCPSW